MNQRALPFTLISASLMAFSQAALAATWCVNPKGAEGCKTTISAAVAAAAAGDTIYVGHGTYKEGVILTKSLSKGRAIKPPSSTPTANPMASLSTAPPPRPTQE